MAKIPTSELAAILEAERSDSLSAQRASELSEQRTTAMDYYTGDMSEHMPSLPDRSSAVSTDVSDVVVSEVEVAEAG